MWANLWFERVLRFARKDTWISRLLRDAAFSWRPEKLLCGLKTLQILGDFAIWPFLVSANIYKYYFNLREFLEQRIHALVEKLENRCFCWFLAAILVSLKKTPPWRFHTKLYKFGDNVSLNISHLKYCTNLILGKDFVYSSSFISQILDFLYWMVCISLFFMEWQGKPRISRESSRARTPCRRND